jgi:aminoglycoside phosphotransferase (APT) family kinase protein
MSSTAIPTTWADVTAEWMTDAISRVHPDAEVGDVHLLLEDDGTNRRARFGLSYAAGSGPETVFVKAEAPAHREVHARNGNLFNEADLYGSGVVIPVDHPLPYRVVIDRPGLDYVIVMEDLAKRGADPRDATRPLTIEQTANGVRSLAALHSAFWGFSGATRPELAWVQTWEPTEGFQSGLRRRVPTGLERAAGVLPAEVARYRGDEIVDLWVRFVSSLTSGAMTLLHADPHIGNTYVLPDDQVGFLDWEVTRRGNWSQDLGYFVIGALTEDDRRSAQDELLDEYLAALDVPAATRPSRDDAWLRFRGSAAYALAIWLSTLGTDGWQRREVSLALAQRFAVAFAELDTANALDELGL